MGRGAIRLITLALLLLGCGSPPTRGPAAPRAVLVVVCPQRDAEVWVDSEYLREVQELRRGVYLPVGKHRVEVRHEHYHSMYYEIELAPNERKTLQVELAQRLP